MMASAFSLFFCWLRPSWQRTIRPVGICKICTAESVVLTPCPPGPPARQTSIRSSSGFSSRSTSSASGRTATVAVEVWIRPWASVAGHPLDAVHPALVAEQPENRLAGDTKDRFLQAAQLRGTGIEVLDLEPARLGEPVIHPVKIGGENGGFAPAGAGANLDNGIAFLRFIGRQQVDQDGAFEVGHAFLERRNFLLRHQGQVGVGRGGEFAVVLELPPGGLEFAPAGEKLLDPGVLAHDLAGAFPVLEKSGIGDLAFEFVEATAFTVNKRGKVHLGKRGVGQERVGYKQNGGPKTAVFMLKKLGFLDPDARGLGAAVTAREFFHATGGVDEFLFAGKKRMTGRANADFNVTPRRAGMINRAASAGNVGHVIIGMDIGFHGRKRIATIGAETPSRK